MKSIRIISPDFEQLAEIDDYESLQFTRRWWDIGEFELHINRYKNFVDALQKGNMFILDGQPNKVGIIQYREIQVDENGKITESWIFKGATLQGLMRQRITVPPSGVAYDYKSGSGETVMKHYVTNHFVSPADPNRAIPNLVVAPDQVRGAHVDWQSRYALVSDELTSIGQTAGLGWNITLDLVNKQWVFDVYVARNVTANQSVNPPVIFSPDFESIKTQHYLDSDVDKVNYAYVGGQGQDVDRTIATVGITTGLDRIETFVDASDIDGTGNVTLTQRGQQAIDQSVQTYLQAEIMTPVTRTSYVNGLPVTKLYSPFEYEKDFDLGDIVTIQSKGWGITEDTNIIELKENYEVSSGSPSFTLEGTFGNVQPTLISKLKQKFSNYDRALRN